MADLIVRNLEDDIHDKLRNLARHHDRSMEEEVRHILHEAVMGRSAPCPKLGSRLAERFSACGLDEDIPELRGQPLK